MIWNDWRPVSSEDEFPTFCPECGARTKRHEQTAGYDPKTGERLVTVYVQCGRRIFRCPEKYSVAPPPPVDRS